MFLKNNAETMCPGPPNIGLGVTWVLVFFKLFQVIQMHSQYGKLVTYTNIFLTISLMGGQSLALNFLRMVGKPERKTMEPD